MLDDVFKKLNDEYELAIGGRPFGPQMDVTMYAAELSKLHLYWIERMKNLVRDQETF